MSNIWILLKAQLINFFPINEIRESGNKKQSSMAIASFGIITLSLFCFVYNILTAKTLVHVGQQDLIPAYMVSLSSFSILFLTVFYSNGILFGSRDLWKFSYPYLLKVRILSPASSCLLYLLNFFNRLDVYASRWNCMGLERKFKPPTDYIIFYFYNFCPVDPHVYSDMHGNRYCCRFIFF